MRRIAIVIGLALGLGACVATTGPGPAAGAKPGGSGAQAAKLTPGMTEAQALDVFGPESGFERNPANWDESCLSFAYGSAEAPRYVHAVFQQGKLVRATDGHASLCTYATADDAA